MQGEGFLTGTESVFVRTSGCNLRCWFCDTPYASWAPEGDDLSVDEIVARVDELGCGHVVLTGGEPMLFAELIPLTAGLRGQRRHITIETAGTLYLPVACDLMSISPKLANSRPIRRIAPRWTERHERTSARAGRDSPPGRRVCLPVQVRRRFARRLRRSRAVSREFPEIDRARVMLMPQGTDARPWPARPSGWSRIAKPTICTSARGGKSSGSAWSAARDGGLRSGPTTRNGRVPCLLRKHAPRYAARSCIPEWVPCLRLPGHAHAA